MDKLIDDLNVRMKQYDLKFIIVMDETRSNE